MPLEKATPGKKLRIPAGDWNSICKSAEFFLRDGVGTTGGEARGKAGIPGISVLAKNSTAEQIEAFRPAFVDASLAELLTLDEVEKYRVSANPVLKLIEISDETVGTRHVVIPQEPIPAGEIGRVVFRGLTAAYVDCTEAVGADPSTVPFVGLYYRNTVQADLRSQGATGVGRLLQYPDTGEQICLIDLNQLPVGRNYWAGPNTTLDDAVITGGFSFTISPGSSAATYDIEDSLVELPGAGVFDVDLRLFPYLGSEVYSGGVPSGISATLKLVIDGDGTPITTLKTWLICSQSRFSASGNTYTDTKIIPVSYRTRLRLPFVLPSLRLEISASSVDGGSLSGFGSLHVVGAPNSSPSADADPPPPEDPALTGEFGEEGVYP